MSQRFVSVFLLILDFLTVILAANLRYCKRKNNTLRQVRVHVDEDAALGTEQQFHNLESAVPVQRPSSSQQNFFSRALSYCFPVLRQVRRIHPGTDGISGSMSHRKLQSMPQALVAIEHEFHRLASAENPTDAANCLLQTMPMLLSELSADSLMAAFFHFHGKKACGPVQIRVVLDLADWTAKTIAAKFPRHYLTFLNWVITENCRFDIYLAVLKHCNVMEVAEADSFLKSLTLRMLGFKLDANDYSTFFRFNQYFLEFAAVYTNIDQTTFVSKRAIPEEIIFEEKLDMLFSSVLLVKSLQCPGMFVDLIKVKSALTNLYHVKLEDHETFLFATQLNIIFGLRGLAFFKKVSEQDAAAIADFVFELIEVKAKIEIIFADLESFRAVGVIINKQLNTLCELYLKYVHSRKASTHSNYEIFSTLVLMADKRLGLKPDFLVRFMGLVDIDAKIVSKFLEMDADFMSVRLLAYTCAYNALVSIPRQTENDIFSSDFCEAQPLTLQFLDTVNYAQLSNQDLLNLALLVSLRLWSIDIRSCLAYQILLTKGGGLDINDVANVLNNCFLEIGNSKQKFPKYQIEIELI